MEIAKKVQASQQKIASGFCALRDKHGNWIAQTVSMDSDQQLTRGQDLPFHPCPQIQADLAKHGMEILLPCQNSHVLNQQVQIDGAEQNQGQTMAHANTVERRSGYNR
ncbi:MAG: hypothetical protein NC133_03820 [Prevotella sp.]|nr:hypothetical protein [Prevotella sp.]